MSGAPGSNKDARAEAAASKAYAKAQRPWYKKKRWLFALGLILLAIVAAASGGGGNDSPSDDAARRGSAATRDTTTASSSGSGAGQSSPNSEPGSPPLSDGDWTLEAVSLHDDGVGDFGGSGRVTYHGENAEGGTNLFTLTVFKSGEQVAVLNGSANSVKPGDTATVQWISQDHYVGGPYRFDFQNDL